MAFVRVDRLAEELHQTSSPSMIADARPSFTRAPTRSKVKAAATTVVAHMLGATLLLNLSFEKSKPASARPETKVFNLSNAADNAAALAKPVPRSHSYAPANVLDTSATNSPEWSVRKIAVPPTTSAEPAKASETSASPPASAANEWYDPYAGAVARRRNLQPLRPTRQEISSDRLSAIKRRLQDALPGHTGLIEIRLSVSPSGWIKSALLLRGNGAETDGKAVEAALIGFRIFEATRSRETHLRIRLSL